MNSWSVSTRISAGFSVTTLIVIAIAGFAYLAAKGLGSSFSGYRATAKQTINVNAIAGDLYKARVAALKYRLNPSEDTKADVVGNMTKIIKLGANDAYLGSDADFNAQISSIAGAARVYQADFLEMTQHLDTATQLRDNIYTTGKSARVILSELGDLALQNDETALLTLQSQAQQSLLLGRFYAEEYFVTEKPEYFDRAIGYFDQSIENVSSIPTLVSGLPNSSIRAETSELSGAALPEIEVVRGNLVTARAEMDQIIELREESLDRIGPDLQNQLEGMVQTIVARQDTLGPQGQQIVDRMNWMSLLAGGIAVFIAIATAIAVSLSITRPLRGLAQTTEKLADGDTDVTISGAEYNHELGKMSQALEIFRKSYLDRDRQTKEAAQNARSELEGMVKALSLGLADLAQGDLSSRVTEEFAEEYEELRKNFNSAVAQLEDALHQIANVSDVIANSSNEINDGTNELNRRTENQAATLEETAAALEELTSSVQSSAGRTSEVKEVVNLARQEAQDSGDVVKRAVAAMDDIEQSSSQISQITEVISDIAFQTNLLALNAGVEAARAGEAGRGFAVVASEVSALAQRSSQAAQEVSDLLTASTKQVHSGTEQVNETGNALDNIIRRVDHITSLVSEITTSATEQANGITEISVGVNELDRATQQNASMTVDSFQQGQDLAVQAQKLKSLMSRFKLIDADEMSDAAVVGGAQMVRLAG